MRIVELKPVLLILVELILYSGQYTQNKNGFVTFERSTAEIGRPTL